MQLPARNIELGLIDSSWMITTIEIVITYDLESVLWLRIFSRERLVWGQSNKELYTFTRSKSTTQITRSVHGKFNFITVKYIRTQHGIYIIWEVD